MRDRLPRPLHQTSSLRDALPIISDLTPNLAHTPLRLMPDQDDVLFWRWTADGSYSANSVYKMLLGGGMINWRYMRAWKCYAPLKAKNFVFLVLKRRILTHDLMARRGMMCDMRCVLCNSCSLEDAFHLLFSCPYAIAFWNEVSSLLGWRLMVVGSTVKQTWDRSWHASRVAGVVRRKEWPTRFICAIWGIWRQRNEMVFRGKAMPSRTLANSMKEESDLWLRCCRGNGQGRLM